MRVENVRGIIWDMDGTLLDSFGIFEQILVDVARQNGYTVPTNEHMHKNYHGTLEETLRRVLNINQPTKLDAAKQSFLDYQVKHYADDINSHLFKDAVNLARAAAKLDIRQLVVTNRAHKGRGLASPKAIVANTELSDYILEVYAGDEVTHNKPDKRSTGNWLEKNGLSPEHVVVIGDQFVDAQLAINTGARAILINRSGTIPHIETHGHDNHDSVFIVDSLSEVELV